MARRRIDADGFGSTRSMLKFAELAPVLLAARLLYQKAVFCDPERLDGVVQQEPAVFQKRTWIESRAYQAVAINRLCSPDSLESKALSGF
jgi:hypothetical protein